MFIFGVVSAWVAVLGLLIMFEKRLGSSKASAEFNRAAGEMLASSSAGDWSRRVSSLFLLAFDQIYLGTRNRFSNNLWVVFIGAGVLSLFFQVPLAATSETRAQEALTKFVVIVLFTYPGMILGSAFPRVAVKGFYIFFGVYAVVVVPLQLFVFDLNLKWDGVVILVLAGLGFGAAITEFQREFPKFVAPEFPVSLVRAMVSSMVVVTIMSLLAHNEAKLFLDTSLALDYDRLLLLSYIGFNLIADPISLLETRWILEKGRDAGPFRLMALLVVDLLASAAIFLFVPLILWEWQDFIDAVRFEGNRPWLGILFYSTFATSVMFYGFVISAVLTPVVMSPVLLTKWLKFDYRQDPWLGILLTSAVVVTLLFAALIGLVIL